MEFLFLLIMGVLAVVVVDAIASWFVRTPNGFPRNITGPIVEPLYAPIRKILSPEKTGGLDLSPLIVIVGLQVLENVLRQVRF